MESEKKGTSDCNLPGENFDGRSFHQFGNNKNV